MKNSSRFEATIAANFTRSSRGFDTSAASSATRSLNASQESSRLKKSSGVRSRFALGRDPRRSRAGGS